MAPPPHKSFEKMSLSGIDPGLLPHARRRIYGNKHLDPRRKTLIRDTEDEVPPASSSSPVRPGPTTITFGGYAVTPAGPNESRKRKRDRKSSGAPPLSMVNDDSDSAAPAVVQPQRRRKQARKKRRSGDGAAHKLGGAGDVVIDEGAEGYAADDEKPQSSSSYQAENEGVRKRGRGRKRRRGGRNGGGRRDGYGRNGESFGNGGDDRYRPHHGGPRVGSYYNDHHGNFNIGHGRDQQGGYGYDHGNYANHNYGGQNHGYYDGDVEMGGYDLPVRSRPVNNYNHQGLHYN